MYNDKRTYFKSKMIMNRNFMSIISDIENDVSDQDAMPFLKPISYLRRLGN